MKVTTGYGYLQKNNIIIAKINLVPGEYLDSPGETYHEVKDKSEWDSIEVYYNITEEERRNRKISEKLREIAIRELEGRVS